MPPSPWEGEGFVRSDATASIPSAFPSPGAARHLPYPFCPFGTFPLDKGNRPQGKASLSVTASPCQLPRGGSQGCTFGTLPLASPCGGGAQQGRRGPPSKHKKALPPWGCQGGRGRRGRGCARGRGQPRLNSGDFSRCSGRAECPVSSFVSDQGERITSARRWPAPRRPRSCRSGSWRRPCSCPDRWRGPCP